MAQRRIIAANIGVSKSEKCELPLEDVISELPNDILVHILSFLKIKEAARTSVLSKRWIDLWTYVARLDFDSSIVLDKMAAIADISRTKLRRVRERERFKYVKWVDKVLQSHKALALDEFKVCFDLDKSSQFEIDRWLQDAFVKRVQRLELNFLEFGEFMCCYPNAYTLSFTSLGLSSWESSEKSRSGCCRSVSRMLSDFKSLVTLSLISVNVTGEVLQFFLQNCPVLKYLVVQGAEDLISLEVSGPSLALQHLEISYCINLKSVIVRDTNLVSLKLLRADTLVLANVPMLVDVYISGSSDDLVKDVVSWLSCCLLNLRVLTVFASLITRKAKLHELHELPELPKLRELNLVAEASKDVSLIGFTSLIAASPNLEKFVLKEQWFHNIIRENSKSNKAGRANRKYEKGVSFPLQHLKVVELYGYYGRQSDLELVHYFVENAVALEKMIIDPRSQSIIPRRRPQTGIEIKREKKAKFYAKGLEGLIPSHVEFVIL